MRVFVVIGLMLMLLSACTTPAPTMSASEFKVAEHEPYLAPGENSLSGQGFLRQRGGGVVTCAGSEVMLVPATSFWLKYYGLIRSTGRIPEIDGTVSNRFAATVQRTHCDAGGNFTFSSIADGDYIVSVSVSWSVGQYSSQGGLLAKVLRLTGNESYRSVLTAEDMIRSY